MKQSQKGLPAGGASQSHAVGWETARRVQISRELFGDSSLLDSKLQEGKDDVCHAHT